MNRPQAVQQPCGLVPIFITEDTAKVILFF